MNKRYAILAGLTLLAASSAFATTSARSTIPAPPPAGLSSTLRCLPSPKLRKSSVSSRHSP